MQCGIVDDVVSYMQHIKRTDLEVHSLNNFIEHLLCTPGMDPSAGDTADNKTDPNPRPQSS